MNLEHKTSEVVEIKGRKFVIKMMPAAESIAVLKELLTRAVPFDLFSGISISRENRSLSVGDFINAIGLNNSRVQMSIDEFSALETRLMKCVSERMPHGDEEVLNSSGQFRVDDIENDIGLYLDLLIQIVKVNYKDFFIEKLQDLKLVKKEK